MLISRPNWQEGAVQRVENAMVALDPPARVQPLHYHPHCRRAVCRLSVCRWSQMHVPRYSNFDHLQSVPPPPSSASSPVSASSAVSSPAPTPVSCQKDLDCLASDVCCSGLVSGEHISFWIYSARLNSFNRHLDPGRALVLACASPAALAQAVRPNSGCCW
jgi:hypothetical protein